MLLSYFFHYSCCRCKGSLELIHPVLIDETDQVVDETGISNANLDESVIGGCLLDHHSPVSSSQQQQQPDLPFCDTTTADAQKKIPEESTTATISVSGKN